MSDNENLINEIQQLNKKLCKRVQQISNESKQKFNLEYIIIKNFLEGTHIQDLVEIAQSPKKNIINILKSYSIIRTRGRRWFIQKKHLRWMRTFIKELILFLNYPETRELNEDLKWVNHFIENQKRSTDFRIALVGVFESNDLVSFSKDDIDEIRKFLKDTSSGLAKFYLTQLYTIIINFFPEIKTKVLIDHSEKIIEEEIETDEIFEEYDEANIKDLIDENQRLIDELGESRAICDILAMQYDDLKENMEKLQKKSYDRNLIKIFKEFNSVENNFALNAFFIAKSTLNDLKKNGWKPLNTDLKSVLFIFDLFTEFFKRQELSTKYDLGEIIEITDKNVMNFNFKGRDITKGMKIFAKVRTPAWYFKNKLISKANVIEINQKGSEY